MPRASATVDLVANDGRFNAAMDRVTARMASVRGAMEAVSRTARRMLLVAAAGATAAVLAFGSFEQKMNQVKARTQATSESVERLAKLARELGKATVFSANQAAEAMSALAASGFSVVEIMETMPSVLNLAAAGMLGMGEAAGITAKILRGMELEAKDLVNVTDVLAKAFTSSSTNIQELGEALKFVGPIASNAGLSIQETVAALQILAQQAFTASLGGTALRNALLRMQTTKVTNFLKGFGETIINVETGALIPFRERLIVLQRALDKVGGSAAQQSKLIELFGVRAGPGLLILLKQGADGFDRWLAKLQNISGFAKSVARQQLEGLFGDFKLVASAATEAAIAVGQILMPAVKSITAGVLATINAFNDMGAATKRSIVNWGIFATAVTAVVAVVTPFLTVAIVIVKTMKTMAAVTAIMNGALLVQKRNFAATYSAQAGTSIVKMTRAIVAQGAAVRAMTLSTKALRITMLSFFGVATIAAGVFIERWLTLNSLINEATVKLGTAIAPINQLAIANRDLAKAAKDGTRQEIAALDAKTLAVENAILALKEEKKQIEDNLSATLNRSRADLRTINEGARLARGGGGSVAEADRSRISALARNKDRQIQRLIDEKAKIDDTRIALQDRLAVEKELAAQEELARVRAAEKLEAEAERARLDAPGVAALKALKSDLLSLQGFTEGQIQLFDLEDLKVAPGILDTIADKQREIADLAKEQSLAEKESLRIEGLRADARALFVASLTDEERLRRKIADVAFLEAEGILNAFQAEKIRASFGKAGGAASSLQGQITTGEALFRRITEAAGGKKTGGKNPAETTAVATAATAKEVKKSTSLASKLGTSVDEIATLIRDALAPRATGQVVGVYGAG